MSMMVFVRPKTFAKYTEVDIEEAREIVNEYMDNHLTYLRLSDGATHEERREAMALEVAREMGVEPKDPDKRKSNVSEK